jgi:hypothetical protein
MNCAYTYDYSQPTRALKEAGADLFTFKQNECTLIVDTFSTFYDFKKLGETTSFEVIQQLKCWFALFDIPSKLYSDNGPQFNNDWKFAHCTSST